MLRWSQYKIYTNQLYQIHFGRDTLIDRVNPRLFPWDNELEQDVLRTPAVSLGGKGNNRGSYFPQLQNAGVGLDDL